MAISKPKPAEQSKPRRRSRKGAESTIEFALLLGLSERTYTDLKSEDLVINTCNQILDDPASTTDEKLRAIAPATNILAERIKIAGQVMADREKNKKEKPAPAVEYDNMMYG
jgi:hypothetical protein